MLQLVYISTARGEPLVSQILAVSRRNNSRDGITGLLYHDGVRFLQALEGPTDKVEAAFERIRADEQHRAAVVLSRREVETREFGSWEMAARRPGAEGNDFIDRVAPLLASVSPNVRGTFEGFFRVKRAA
ncbi:BLUF domain-containing protein [uncultured Sphingomonas sp.]|uniref:BLUF domain-containing protein n=1 Tax=uncultured Sphingomonas sp. TaxID=158754 RepID=UPI0035CBB8CA